MNWLENHKDNSRTNYYYEEDGKIGYSSEGDGIHIAEIKSNPNCSHFSEELVQLLNIILGEPELKKLIESRIDSEIELEKLRKKGL